MSIQILCFVSSFLSNISNSPQGEREGKWDLRWRQRRHQAASAPSSGLQLTPTRATHPILCLGLRQHWVPISALPLNDLVTLDTRFISLSLECLLLYLGGCWEGLWGSSDTLLSVVKSVPHWWGFLFTHRGDSHSTSTAFYKGQGDAYIRRTAASAEDQRGAATCPRPHS